MIEIKGVSKDYSGFSALEGIDLEIRGGETVALLGHNGAGKTTLMRIMSGFIPASYGEVKVGGLDVLEEGKEAKKLIGYLPENCPLYTEMVVWDFLYAMGELRGVCKGELSGRVEEVMRMVRIEGKRGSVINNLSKGYRQRVGIAQSLIHNPRVLILDEPTVGLDPVQIIEIRGLIESLQDGDRTIILSTHILPEASQVCDRILIISGGKIRGDGSERELMEEVRGGNKIYIEVGGGVEGVLGVLKGEFGLEGELKGGVEGGVGRVEVEVGEDLRSDLLKALIENGVKVLEFKREDITLEKVFIKLAE